MALNTTLHLPLQVTSPVDVGRLLRELESIDSLLSQAALRKEVTTKLPKTTGLMDQTIMLNKIDLSDSSQRKVLADYLKAVKSKAPVLHMSFSADPSTAFIEKLLTWLRKELDVNVLVTVGLQPTIGAGCIVRSTNKYFDFSLRQDFASKRGLLLDKMEMILGASNPTSPAAAAPQAGSVTDAIKTVEANRAPAPASQAMHTPPQPTAKLMTPKQAAA